MADPLMDLIKNSEEPEWLERTVIGEMRVWQIMFLCIAGLTTSKRVATAHSMLTPLAMALTLPEGSQVRCRPLNILFALFLFSSFFYRCIIRNIFFVVVMVCCCFRFRIPRTKQQIEADYKRRRITRKFRQQLETIQDSKMDSISLKDALELLHETSHSMEENQGSPPSSIMSPQQLSSLETSFHPDQKPDLQTSNSGLSFVKFATKVANLSKLSEPTSPTSPTAPGKMDF